jgi:predicted sulfurtransferase
MLKEFTKLGQRGYIVAGVKKTVKMTFTDKDGTQKEKNAQEIVRDKKEVAKIIALDYRNKYDKDTGTFSNLGKDWRPTNTANTVNPMTKEDLLKAIQQCGSSKGPGWDGFSIKKI